MTCIVGYVEKGIVYLGGDSCAGNSQHYSHRLITEPKVFRNGDFIIGYTTSFRMGQILQHRFIPPRRLKAKTDSQYLITDFVEKLQGTFARFGFGSSHIESTESGSGGAVGGEFLIGYKDKLYKIHSDYNVSQETDPYNSCGCGESYALGALNAVKNLKLKPEEKIIIALSTATKYSAYILPPYTLINNG